MSRHPTAEDVRRDEELRQLRLKHAKTIERSAKVLVELENGNSEAERSLARAKALGHALPDSDKPTH